MWEYKRYIKYIVFEKPRVYQSLQTSIPTMITQMIKYMIYIGFFFQKPQKILTTTTTQMTVGRLWEVAAESTAQWRAQWEISLSVTENK